MANVETRGHEGCTGGFLTFLVETDTLAGLAVAKMILSPMSIGIFSKTKDFSQWSLKMTLFRRDSVYRKAKKKIPPLLTGWKLCQLCKLSVRYGQCSPRLSTFNTILVRAGLISQTAHKEHCDQGLHRRWCFKCTFNTMLSIKNKFLLINVMSTLWEHRVW